jgi:hypothetical protein
MWFSFEIGFFLVVFAPHTPAAQLNHFRARLGCLLPPPPAAAAARLDQ